MKHMSFHQVCGPHCLDWDSASGDSHMNANGSTWQHIYIYIFIIFPHNQMACEGKKRKSQGSNGVCFSRVHKGYRTRLQQRGITWDLMHSLTSICLVRLSSILLQGKRAWELHDKRCLQEVPGRLHSPFSQAPMPALLAWRSRPSIYFIFTRPARIWHLSHSIYLCIESMLWWFWYYGTRIAAFCKSGWEDVEDKT